MAEFIVRPGVNRILLLNTPLQKSNDEYIQQILNQYKYYDEKKEFKENTGKDVDLVISHKPTIPDLVIYNKPFDKNKCFIEAKSGEMNTFPRKQFFIRFNEDNKEQFKKYSNSNKRKKENEKKVDNKSEKDKKNNTNKKEIEIKSGQIRIQEMSKSIVDYSDDGEEEKEEEKIGDKNNFKEQDNEKEEKEVEKDDDDDDDDDDNNDDDNEEKEKDEDEEEESDDEEKEETKETKINNNSSNANKMSEQIADKISNISINENEFFPKNYNKLNNNNNNNTNNICNSSQINDENFNFNVPIQNIPPDNMSDFSDNSLINNLYKLTENSQFQNESFISKASNPINILNSNNLNNTNSNNMNNNLCLQNNFSNNNLNLNNQNMNLNNILLPNILQQQINNNQFNQINATNNLFNLMSNQNPLNNINLLNNNQLNINSISPVLQNNMNPNNLFSLIYENIDNKGWIVYNKDGNTVNTYTSFELFGFFTEIIMANTVKLDDFVIGNNKTNEKYKGGLLYTQLMHILPQVYQLMSEELLKKIQLTKMMMGNNLNNSMGIGNINSNNINLNNNNLNLNSFNNINSSIGSGKIFENNNNFNINNIVNNNRVGMTSGSNFNINNLNNNIGTGKMFDSNNLNFSSNNINNIAQGKMIDNNNIMMNNINKNNAFQS